MLCDFLTAKDGGRQSANQNKACAYETRSYILSLNLGSATASSKIFSIRNQSITYLRLESSNQCFWFATNCYQHPYDHAY